MVVSSEALGRHSQRPRADLPLGPELDYLATMTGDFTISPCPPARRADAVRLLHRFQPSDQQTALVQALEAAREFGDDAFSGLLIASDQQQLVGVTWIQLTPGRTAVVWPPSTENPAAEALLCRVAKFLDARNVVLAQLSLGADAPQEDRLWAAGQFQKLADLTYLTVESPFFPQTTPGSELQFQPRACDEPDRLRALLLRTYEGSQDCPKLNGVRRAEDVIEGYTSQGAFAAERWFFVIAQGQDVGALILTTHGQGENWELVYMGVAPEGRGHGYGWQIVQFALWQARVGRGDRLVLAVDEANEYALSMYRRAGFVSWDRRPVYARLRPQNAD